LTVPW